MGHSGKEKSKAQGTWKVQKRKREQLRITESQESKPLALGLRGGLVLPLLSTLPTNSTCLSRSDPCKYEDVGV